MVSYKHKCKKCKKVSHDPGKHCGADMIQVCAHCEEKPEECHCN